MKLDHTNPPATGRRALAALAALGLSLPALAQDARVPATLAPLEDVKTAAPALPLVKPAPAVRATPAATPATEDGIVKRAIASTATVDRTVVHHALTEDGTLWARGSDWKAGFDRRGASFVPVLGASAPRNFPVGMRLGTLSAGGVQVGFDAQVEPVRAQDLVLFDRGPLVERYTLKPEGIEQSFVLTESVGAGELVLRVALDTELEARQAGEGIELANAHARIGYGRATAIDAHGASVACATTATAHGIEIRVPESFLADAAYPLVVDPVISNQITVAGGDTIEREPDVAYVAGQNRYLAVFEEYISGTDHDVFAKLYDASGAFLQGGYVDISVTSWADPAVAANALAGQFLVVAEAGTVGSRTIRGRTVSASDLALSPSFAISSAADSGEKVDPDVGGDPLLVGPTYYCVVWTRYFSAADSDVHAQLVRPDGTLVSPTTIFVDNTSGTRDVQPSISKSDGSAPSSLQDWTIGWQRVVSDFDSDVWAAQVHWDGVLTTAPFAIDTSAELSQDVEVSSPLESSPRQNLVVWAGDATPGDPNDIRGALVRGDEVLDSVNLSVLGGAVANREQIHPCVDSDGTRFVVGYSQQFGATQGDYDTYAATFTLVGPQLMRSEGPVPIDTSLDQDQRMKIASDRSGGGPAVSGRCFLAWERTVFGGDVDVYARLFRGIEFTSFCRPGEDAQPCPCGNAPSASGRGCDNSSGTGGAVLVASGRASLGSDTMLLQAFDMKPTATCVFLQGTAQANAVFGQGVRCVGGTLKRLYVKTAVGGGAIAPAGAELAVAQRSALLGDPLSAGSTRYYGVYYRDPIVLGGCSSAQTFNTSQAVQAIWAP